MNKERRNNRLKQSSLQKHPFSVPEGYFESFPGRLKDKIAELERSEAPARRIGSGSWVRLAIAATVLGAALISYSLIRFASSNNNGLDYYTDMALLEQMDILDDDLYLVEFLEEGTGDLDDEEAFISQAMDFLAYNDVELDLIFE